jgi:glycosyltransferase involved in cell wall biosynthesis
MEKTLTLAVIIPAYNAAATLETCLNGIFSSTRKPDEIIVYNDGSTDSTVEIAERFGVKVITGENRAMGPAFGRNIAAQSSSADLLVFIDADVQVHNNSIELLERSFLDTRDVVAAFGSYDDAPSSKRIASLYANLRHHFFHQNSKLDATTFWSGFGAVRRSSFLAVGGFSLQFSEPSVEDIEFGVRIRRSEGRIVLMPEAQVKHLKDWRLFQLWRTDIFARALPWSKMIVSGQTAGADLNTSSRERLICVIAHSVWVFGILSALIPVVLFALITAVILFIILNKNFFALLARKGGISLLLSGIILHWFYYLYASIVFALVSVTYRKPLKPQKVEHVASK